MKYLINKVKEFFLSFLLSFGLWFFQIEDIVASILLLSRYRLRQFRSILLNSH
jgi:hypothetical protein